nr:MAG TPA: hypothetical protein [Caudoviricetes sp.]
MFFGIFMTLVYCILRYLSIYIQIKYYFYLSNALI